MSLRFVKVVWSEHDDAEDETGVQVGVLGATNDVEDIFIREVRAYVTRQHNKGRNRPAQEPKDIQITNISK